MATKKTVKRGRVDKQRGNNPKKQRGKPFEKGNTLGFQKGVSGNPAGRPKARTLSEAYRAWLGLPMANDLTRTNADGVAEVIGQNALKGDVAAAREICDRVEGKPRQAIDLTVEQKMREIAENIIKAFMADAGVSDREEAARLLAAATPEISKWVN